MRATDAHQSVPIAEGLTDAGGPRLAIRILCHMGSLIDTSHGPHRCVAAVRANWQATPFDRDSRRHVSTYEREAVV